MQYSKVFPIRWKYMKYIEYVVSSEHVAPYFYISRRSVGFLVGYTQQQKLAVVISSEQGVQGRCDDKDANPEPS